MPFNRHWDHDYQHGHALNAIGIIDYEHGHAHSTQLGSWLSTQSCLNTSGTIDYDHGKYPFHTQLGSWFWTW
jgi:hypothetical protein